MRKTWIVCLISGLLVVGSTALRSASARAAETTQRMPAKVAEESISGRNYLAIQAAMNEFKGYGLDILRYRITVEETETSRYVIFIDADVTEEQKAHVRGSPGKVPGFEVELPRDGLGIVRSNFIR